MEDYKSMVFWGKYLLGYWELLHPYNLSLSK
jgi:hypothetical protein